MLNPVDQPRPTMLTRLSRQLIQPSPWWVWLIFFISSTAIFAWYRIQKPYPLFDTYPLYFGAKAWLTTGNAYHLNIAVDPNTFGYYASDGTFVAPFVGIMHDAGNGYPFPANWLFIPFSLLSPRTHSLIWSISLFAGCLLALRWAKLPPWIMLSFPVLDGLRMEQFTILIVLIQIIALGAWNLPIERRSRGLLLGFASALMLLKPTHGLVTGLVILGYLLYQQQWRVILISYGLIWLVPTIFDLNWPLEWFQSIVAYASAFNRFTPWWMLGFAIFFWRQREYISSFVVAQLGIVPYTWFYATSSLSLGWVGSPLCLILSLLSWCILPIQVLLEDFMPMLDAQLMAATLLMIVPMLILKRYSHKNSAEAPTSTPFLRTL